MPDNEPQINPAKATEICGIIMPISPIDGCSTEHWLEVQDIIRNVIDESGLLPNLVSDSDDIGVIQGRIVQNLYNYSIVICDVSGKNPNVMFELGIRLAFDKPTIIIKDDQTDYSFDTSPIEHIGYPRDLRFSKINAFKEKLKIKLLGTLKKSIEDKNYSPFLKHFGEFIVPKLEQKEVGFNDFVIKTLNNITNEIAHLKRPNNPKSSNTSNKSTSTKKYETPEEKEDFMISYLEDLRKANYHYIEDMKEVVDKYLQSWNNIGYSDNEVEIIFNKVANNMKIPSKINAN